MCMNREGDIRFGKNYVYEIKALGDTLFMNIKLIVYSIDYNIIYSSSSSSIPHLENEFE